MQRYFTDKLLNNNEFELSNLDSYHIKKVMRMNLSDKIEIVYDKKVYISEIINLDNNIKARIIDELSDYNELPFKVILCQSLVNEQKMDLILQKSTELGVSEIYPYKACNSVVKENNKSDKKIIRWQSIVKEASEQSKRNNIPIVNSIIDINTLKNMKASLKLFCSVNEKTKNIKWVLQNTPKCDTMIIVIGPEGGFSKLEEQTLLDNGYVSVSLGKRVLRTETASIVGLSMINYEWMV